MEETLQVIIASLSWALLSTLLTFALAVPLSLMLARCNFRGKSVVSTLFSLPMVLPPTAVGFLLLQLLADDGWMGLDFNILFSWKAVIVACSVMSFPLVVRTARVSFESVDPQLEKVALTLGKSKWNVFCSVTFPLASKGLLAAAILGFTRALGEFGATVTIAGNIPGRTQTLASAIYSAQQGGRDGEATVLLVIALTVGFLAVFLTEWLSRPSSKERKRDA